MTLTSQTISQYIQRQFPSFFQEEGDSLVAFVEAYYEFLESDLKYSTKLSREMFNSNDIDESLEDFKVHFKKKYLADFPFLGATSQEFAIKHIMDYYRSKGSPRALKLLMQMLFGIKSDVYYPGRDVFKASDSKWNVPIYVEVDNESRLHEMVGMQVTGSISGAVAFVEGFVKKVVAKKVVIQVFLSNVGGTFVSGDIITHDGNLINAPKVLGSLFDVNILIGGNSYEIGDVLNVISNRGKGGKVRVTAVLDATGQVRFEIVDGGFGYTLDNFTQVYVSDAVIIGNNNPESFLEMETVYQPFETITLISSEDINENAAIGDTIQGVSPANNVIAEGTIISIANTDASGTIVSTNSSFSTIKLYVDSGTFNTQLDINLTANAQFGDGDLIEEEDEVTLTVFDIEPFNIGEIVEQVEREPVSNLVISESFGTVVSQSNNEIVLSEAWGKWDGSSNIVGRTSSAVSPLVNVTINTPGAVAKYTGNEDEDTITVDNVQGGFTVGNKVRGTRSGVIAEIASVNDSGATDVWLNSNTSSNGVIDTIANNYAVGTLIGQNTMAVGVYANTAPFVRGYNLKTNRIRMVDAPRDSNGDIIEHEMLIEDLGTGADANFRITDLENEEIINVYTDFVGANNVVGQPYIDIQLTGANSGVGFVDSFIIHDGGAGYTNNTPVTFTEGGWAGGEPRNQASGHLETDGSGAITDIVVDVHGSGFYQAPNFTIDEVSPSVEANVEMVMDFGYGFPKWPTADIDDIIDDCLELATMTIGTISRLGGINPGHDYNMDQFVKVINPTIASFNRRDIIVQINNVSGTFQLGEQVLQNVNTSSTAKGSVEFANSTHIILDRQSFGVGFLPSIQIQGQQSGATANIVDISPDGSSRPIGDNAEITGTVIAADGIIQDVEVVDSGYGYETGSEVELEHPDNPTIATGIVVADRQGRGEGYWTSTTSHPSHDKYIHDGRYYQEFSYDVISGISLNRYEAILKSVFHPAGLALFGSVDKQSFRHVNTDVAVTEYSIEPTPQALWSQHAFIWWDFTDPSSSYEVERDSANVIIVDELSNKGIAGSTFDLEKASSNTEYGPELYMVGDETYGVRTRIETGPGDTMLVSSNPDMNGVKTFILAKHIDTGNSNFITGPSSFEISSSPVSIAAPGTTPLEYYINSPSQWSVYEMTFYPPFTDEGGSFGAVGLSIDGGSENIREFDALPSSTSINRLFGDSDGSSGEYLTNQIVSLPYNISQDVLVATREEFERKRIEIIEAEEEIDNPEISLSEISGIYIDGNSAPLGEVNSMSPAGILGITLTGVANGFTNAEMESDGLRFRGNSLRATGVAAGPYTKMQMIVDITVHGDPLTSSGNILLVNDTGSTSQRFWLRYQTTNGMPRFILVGPDNVSFSLGQVKGFGERQIIGGEIDLVAGTMTSIEADGETPTTVSISEPNITIDRISIGQGLDATIHRAALLHEPNVVPVLTQTGGTVSTFTRGNVNYTQVLWDTPGAASFTLSDDAIMQTALVGGGGSGGRLGQAAGGGGAGAAIVDSSPTSYSAGTWDIVIGAGGAAQSAGPGNNGEASLLSLNTVLQASATGGGGGGGNTPGSNGACGGGGGTNSTPSRIGGTGSVGGNGGNAHGAATASERSGGGGGGMSGPGQNGDAAKAGDGGPGVSISFTQTTMNVSGGGGGAIASGTNHGNGIHGGTPGASGTSEDAVRGGGSGGASGSGSSGKGGDGMFVLVVRSNRVTVV